MYLRLQAQSKQKIIDKMMAKGLTEPVTHESTFSFNFPDCEKLPPPVLPFINVSFAYSGKKEDYLYQVRRRATRGEKQACACLSHHYLLQPPWASPVGDF